MKHDKNGIIPAKRVLGHLRTKSDADPIDMLAQKFADMTDTTLERLQASEKKLEAMEIVIDDHDKKLFRSKLKNNMQANTWGQEFIYRKGDEIAELAQDNSGSVHLNLKSTLTTGATSGGAIDVPDRDAGTMLPKKRLPVRALLNVIQTDSGTIQYAAQTTRDNQAATAAETTLKAESGYEWELRMVSPQVIAHFTKASTQILSDAPQVQGMVDSELRYGLALKEEEQILFGDNTGSNLDGLVPNATAYDNTAISGYTPATDLDDIGIAILQAYLSDHVPNGIVLHPSNWMRMRLLKDGDGKYLFGNPQEVVTPNLFGLPVVTTQSMTVNKFLLGDFNAVGTLYDRWQPRVELGFVNDDFTRNMVTLRAEERIALAVKHGDALIYGDLAA